MKKAVALGCAILAAGLSPASAQSLFNQTPAPEAASQAEAAPARKPRPKKPRVPTPARSLVISNASATALTSLEISAEGKTAKLDKPLAAKARTTLKLPALKTCTVTVSASFEGSGEAEASDYDVCKEKSIRFTE